MFWQFNFMSCLNILVEALLSFTIKIPSPLLPTSWESSFWLRVSFRQTPESIKLLLQTPQFEFNILNNACFFQSSSSLSACPERCPLSYLFTVLYAQSLSSEYAFKLPVLRTYIVPCLLPLQLKLPCPLNFLFRVSLKNFLSSSSNKDWVQSNRKFYQTVVKGCFYLSSILRSGSQAVIPQIILSFK